ncbi:type IV secretory system conjugative DNA transfer family protein [Thiomonas sp.]
MGRKDAWALAALAGGIAGSSPWLAGQADALGMAAPALLGGTWLGWKKASGWLDRVNPDIREGFVLRSDKLYPPMMGSAGLRAGYTRDHSRPVDIANDLWMRHTAIIGQSGVGKTTLGEFLLWQQIVRGGGFIFIDAKLDFETRNKLAHMMWLAGREDEFYVLNVSDPAQSNTYNPLLSGDADEVASRLLNLLPSAENNPGADYYRQSANYALTVLIGGLKAANYRYHYGDLTILLQSPRALAELERMIPPGAERATFQVFIDQYKRKPPGGGPVQIDLNQLKQVLGGMSGRIAQFAQGQFGQVFNTYAPEIDLIDIVVNNKALYVMLPTMSKDTAALNLGKMIMSDLRTAVARVQGMPERDRPNPPFIVFADEMGSYVMPGISRLFEQARSAQICMIPAFQSFANLAVVSPEFADMIIQNTWNKIFFKFGSKDSPELAAEIIGKTKRYAYSLSQSESSGNSAQVVQAGPQSSETSSGGLGETWREQEEFRVTPDQLKSLGKGEAFVMSGSRIFHVNTPMLLFGKRIPEFQVLRRPTTVPKEENVLNFTTRYREFLSDSGDPGVPVKA